MRIREIFWAAFWLALAGLMVIYSKSNAADRRHAEEPAAVSTSGNTLIALWMAPILLESVHQGLSPGHLAERSATALHLAYGEARRMLKHEELALNETRFRVEVIGTPDTNPQNAPATDREMTFLVVKDDSKDCKPHCGRWLAGVGKITENSYGRLVAALAATRGDPLPLILDSPGGQINAAISIGEVLREHHIAVSVAKTMLGDCDASRTDCDAKPTGNTFSGHLVAEGARCVSACPFLFMGGTTRVVEGPAVLGVHRVTMIRQPGHGDVAEGFADGQSGTSAGNGDGLSKPVRVRILHYLRAMGVDQEVFDLMMRTPPEKMDILSPLELDVYRIITGPGSAAGLAGAA